MRKLAVILDSFTKNYMFICEVKPTDKVKEEKVEGINKEYKIYDVTNTLFECDINRINYEKILHDEFYGEREADGIIYYFDHVDNECGLVYLINEVVFEKIVRSYLPVKEYNSLQTIGDALMVAIREKREVLVSETLLQDEGKKKFFYINKYIDERGKTREVVVEQN